MEKTRLAKAFDAEIAASHRAVIAALEAACAEVERRLEPRSPPIPHSPASARILTSIPGIGGRIAGVVIADMPELGSLDRKSAASLAGMAAHPDQSGTLPRRRVISGGRPCLRTAFYIAGMVAARCDPRLKAAYRAMRDAESLPRWPSSPPARRLVTIADALVRENKTSTRAGSSLDRRTESPATSSRIPAAENGVFSVGCLTPAQPGGCRANSSRTGGPRRG